jgi:hypothetical protein
MSASQVLSGTPAGLSVPSGADSFLGLAATVASAPAVGAFVTPGYVEWLEGSTSGATQRNFRRWVGLGTAGVSRKTVEDYGYDVSLATPTQRIQRYTQYKPVSSAFGALSQNGGEVCLNWGLLDTARSGVLTPGNTPGGVFAGPILTINDTDLVWFFPQTIGAAPFVAPTLVSVQPGVGFTINAVIPAGETWRYLVVAGPAVA